MKPALIFGGSFLFWIAARGRFPAYSALVNRAATPSSSPVQGGGALDSAASIVNSTVSKIWEGLKGT